MSTRLFNSGHSFKWNPRRMESRWDSMRKMDGGVRSALYVGGIEDDKIAGISGFTIDIYE